MHELSRGSARTEVTLADEAAKRPRRKPSLITRLVRGVREFKLLLFELFMLACLLLWAVKYVAEKLAELMR